MTGQSDDRFVLERGDGEAIDIDVDVDDGPDARQSTPHAAGVRRHPATRARGKPAA